MKLAIALTFLFLAACNDKDKTSDTSIHLSPGQVNAAQAVIIRAGKRCDAVSGAVENGFTGGYRINCNDFRYNYDLVDNGSGWEVR